MTIANINDEPRPDLSTRAGQVRHYAAIRDRLWHPKPLRVIAPPPRPSWMPADASITVPFDFYAMPSWQSLLRFASLKTGVSERLIMSRERTVEVVHARYMTMALMKHHLEVSLPMIGRRWGVDHTSVLHGIRRYQSGQIGQRVASCVQARQERERHLANVPRRPRGKTMQWTAGQLAEAKLMRASGLMVKEIAEHFGVSDNAMQAAMKRAALRESEAAAR